MEIKKKILIGSPIHQKPLILEEFLKSLLELKKNEVELHFLFIDDNLDKSSSEILSNWALRLGNARIIKSEEKHLYNTSGLTHQWTQELIWKVAAFKNYIIEEAISNNYDYLFLIDSDLILHPNTVEHLMYQSKDIISEIFWTKWYPESIALPQVWISDHYTLYKKGRQENLSEEEKNRRILDFLNELQKPGVYEVGGLGACTLISRNALLKGVNFREIPNVSFWGEDRHFCIRAASLGIKLHVDTMYPAYHIYRDEDLSGVKYYKEENKSVNMSIFETVYKGMKYIGSFDYRNPNYSVRWQNYFTKECARIILEQLNKGIDSNKEKCLIVEAEVTEFHDIKISGNYSLADMRFILRNRGEEFGKSFEEDVLVNASLIYKDNKWMIQNYEVIELIQSETENKNININPYKLML